jgi:hypothetical protein
VAPRGLLDKTRIGGKDRIFAVPVSTAVGEEQPVSTKDTAIRATLWNEHVEERRTLGSGALYPEGIHATVARGCESC